MTSKREFAKCPQCCSNNVQLFGTDSWFCLDCDWDEMPVVTAQSDPLTVVLRYGNAHARREAVQSLINTGDMERHLASSHDLEPLLEALEDPDDDVRYFATVALGRLGDIRALRTLKKVRRSDSSELVRQGAITAIDELNQ